MNYAKGFGTTGVLDRGDQNVKLVILMSMGSFLLLHFAFNIFSLTIFDIIY